MLKRSLSLSLAIVAVSVALLSAAPVNIKLATQAPPNTTWHKALLDMGDAWMKTTDGRVKLTVYAGGTQGDEAATLKMMRPGIDTLQAGLYTSGALASIDDSFNVRTYTRAQVDALNAEAACKALARTLVQVARCEVRR